MNCKLIVKLPYNAEVHFYGLSTTKSCDCPINIITLLEAAVFVSI